MNTYKKVKTIVRLSKCDIGSGCLQVTPHTLLYPLVSYLPTYLPTYLPMVFGLLCEMVLGKILSFRSI